MTRQDFRLIAEEIQNGRENFKSNQAHIRFALSVADRLAWTNPRLDKVRFIRACMPTAWVGTKHEAAWEQAAAKEAK